MKANSAGTEVPATGRSPAQLPKRLADAIWAAHLAEQTAAGHQRRAAFRHTRSLLGGAMEAGYPAQLLAECLGVSVATVRNRATFNAYVDLAALPPVVSGSTLARWHRSGALGGATPDSTGRRLYRAEAVVRLLSTTRPARSQMKKPVKESDRP